MSRILPEVNNVNVLPFLPVEMWIIILRLLDPKSLLAGVRSYDLWMTVCRGDSVLRQRLRRAVKEEQLMVRNFIMDPRMSVRVSRPAPSKLFAVNVKKNVVASTKPSAGVLPNFGNYDESKQRQTGKSTKPRGNSRFCPYRLITKPSAASE